jgi:hypothetical protein
MRMHRVPSLKTYITSHGNREDYVNPTADGEKLGEVLVSYDTDLEDAMDR